MSASHVFLDRGSDEEVSGILNRTAAILKLKEYRLLFASQTGKLNLNDIGTDLILRLKSNLSSLNSPSNYNLELSYFEELFNNKNSISDYFKIKSIKMLRSLLELKLAVFANYDRQVLFEPMLQFCVDNSQELLKRQQLEIQQKHFYDYAPSYEDRHQLERLCLINATEAIARAISEPSQNSLDNIGSAISDLNRLRLDSKNDKIILGMVGGLCLVGGIVGSVLLSPFFGVLVGIGAFLIYQAHNVRKQEAEHAKRYNSFLLFTGNREGYNSNEREKTLEATPTSKFV